MTRLPHAACPWRPVVITAAGIAAVIAGALTGR